MIKRTLFISLFLAGGWMLSATQPVYGQAEELKIGYVDPQAILSRMPETKAVQQKLQNFWERKQQEVRQREQDLQQALQALEEKKSLTVVSKDAIEREEQRLSQMYMESEQFKAQVQQEFQERQQELVGPLLQQIREAIDVVASKMGLVYVINATTTNGDVIILYASPEAQQKYNITDRVMRQLGI